MYPTTATPANPTPPKTRPPLETCETFKTCEYSDTYDTCDKLISEAIFRTVHVRKNGKNSAQFRFARKLRKILPEGCPAATIADAGRRFAIEAMKLNPELSKSELVADVMKAYRAVQVPDGGNILELAEEAIKHPRMKRPHFVDDDEPEDSPVVKLGKLVLALDAYSDKPTFVLSGRDAARICGTSQPTASKLLNLWHELGFIECVVKGKQGSKSKQASKWILRHRDTCNNQTTTPTETISDPRWGDCPVL